MSILLHNIYLKTTEFKYIFISIQYITAVIIINVQFQSLFLHMKYIVFEYNNTGYCNSDEKGTILHEQEIL